MKKILYPLLFTMLITTGCSDQFLEKLPKGYYHHGNFTDSLDVKILTEAKVMEAYAGLRSWDFAWNAPAMHGYITPDSEKGSTPADGGDKPQFKLMTFTASSGTISGYYENAYSIVRLANEALGFLSAPGVEKDALAEKLTAESLFLRALMYFRLTQAFGDVSWVDRVLGPNDKTPARTPQNEIYAKIEADLIYAIPLLPTRIENQRTRNNGRATQNAARALLAKLYLYQKRYNDVLVQTSSIIASGDNDLNTPYDQIFDEVNEFGPESIFEVDADFRPEERVFNGSQYAQMQGIRGTPNLGWGFAGPSTELIAAYEPGDPRKAATVLGAGDIVDGDVVVPDPGAWGFFNKKMYPKKSERSLFGRTDGDQGQWKNIRLIRYADVVLMHAEAANEVGNTDDALDKLEMVRRRARGNNSSVLPKVTERSQEPLRDKIRFERRIELALEFERYFDLIRWGVAKDVIPNFVVGKHELFPIPQSEIDKSNGILTQNPKY